MSELVKETIDIINNWTINSCGQNPGWTIYLFGTLVNRGGAGFSQGDSDVDLVVVFEKYENALKDTYSLSNLVPSLEASLVKKLKRSGDMPICSVVSISQIESYYSIHKGNDVNLLSGSRFLRLGEVPVGGNLVSISQSADDSIFYHQNHDLVSTIAFSQKIRSEFLSVSFNEAYSRLVDWNGPEPLPKALMRQAAICGWQSLSESPTRREDINVGLRYVLGLIAKSASTPEIINLRDKIEDRIMNRGDKKPISGKDQLLLANLLYLDACKRIVPSTRAILDAVSSSFDGMRHEEDAQE